MPTAARVIFSHNKHAYIHIYMCMQHHNDTINRQTHHDKVARTNDALLHLASVYGFRCFGDVNE